MKYMTKTFFLSLNRPNGFLSHNSYFLLLAVPLLIVVLLHYFFLCTLTTCYDIKVASLKL